MLINPGLSFEVSIIIPTYQAGAELRELLARLWNQSKRPKEIIVIDSTSPDGTAALAAECGAVVLTVDKRDYDHGGTRNYAASHAQGDILVFMTQDAVPANEALIEELVRPLTDEQVGCVYGRQLARVDASLLERTAREYNYSTMAARKMRDDIPHLGIKTFFCSNACSAIRKDVFVQIGGFLSPVIFNEDLFMAAQCIFLDLAVVYAPSAEVVHSHHYSLLQLFRRYFDNGVSMRRNDWILKYSAIGKAGTGLVAVQFKEIKKRKEWRLIPRWFSEALAKYAGYQLGKYHHWLPDAVCHRLSMHRAIWRKLQNEQREMTLRG